MEIEPRPIFSYANRYTQRFLFTVVVQEGLEEARLPMARPAAWRRKIEVGHLFYDQGFSLIEIGEKFGFTRQRAAQLKDGYIRGLHQRAHPALQNGFPLRMIPLGKNDLDLGIKISRSHEGYLAKVLDSKRQGETSEQAVANIATSSPLRSRLRRQLRSYGFQTPYVTRPPHIIAEIKAKLRVTDDYNETAKLLEEINTYRLYAKCIKEPNPVVVNLSSIAAEAGFHGLNRHMEDFFDSLTSVGLPVQILRIGRKQPKKYYILSKRHKEEAKQLLLLDQTLAKYL